MEHAIRSSAFTAALTPIAQRLILGGLLSLPLASGAAGFVDDSKASLTLRNYYMDRDFKDDGAKSAAREWAQGFIAKFESGYTEGTVGVGFDAMGLVGLKLDSSPDRTGTEVLPVSRTTGRAADEYSRIAPTGKLRIGKTEIKGGDIAIFLPFAIASPARLLPQTFRGGYAYSRDIDGLTLHGGYLDRINRRNSTDYEPMTVASPNGRFNPAATTSHMAFAGGDYRPTDKWLIRAYRAEVADLYEQNVFTLFHTLPIGDGAFTSDFRGFFSDDLGSAKAGKVDNRNLSAQFAYALGGHKLTVGYMHLSGDTATPYISGTELGVIGEFTMSSDFLNTRERVWQAIYDYDFLNAGLPGLKARLRYVRGDNIELAAFGADGLKERELQMEIGYVVQGGPLKGVGFKARQSIYRNDFPGGAAFRDENQLRLHIDYTLALW